MQEQFSLRDSKFQFFNLEACDSSVCKDDDSVIDDCSERKSGDMCYALIDDESVERGSMISRSSTTDEILVQEEIKEEIEDSGGEGESTS